MKKKNNNVLLSIICIILVVGSLYIGTMKHGKFEGADDQIEGVITQMDANYKPWFKHIWEPPSGEIESLLFAVQAAIGAGFIGYYIGRKKNGKINNGSCQK